MEKKKKKQFCVVSGETISTFYPFFIHDRRKGRKRKEVRGETRGWIGSTFSWSMPEPQLCRYQSDKISKAFGLWCQIWLFILMFDLEILTQDQIDGMEENEQMNQMTLPRTLNVLAFYGQCGLCDSPLSLKTVTRYRDYLMLASDSS